MSKYHTINNTGTLQFLEIRSILLKCQACMMQGSEPGISPSQKLDMKISG